MQEAISLCSPFDGSVENFTIKCCVFCVFFNSHSPARFNTLHVRCRHIYVIEVIVFRADEPVGLSRYKHVAGHGGSRVADEECGEQ